MYLRDHNGKLIKFDWKKYKSEKQMYHILWKTLFNTYIKDEKCDTNKQLLTYISR